MDSISTRAVPKHLRAICNLVLLAMLVPLAREICPVIDTAGRRIVIEPPEGLLDLNRGS